MRGGEILQEYCGYNYVTLLDWERDGSGSLEDKRIILADTDGALKL